MAEHTYLLTIGLMLGTVLLVFGFKYFSAAYQARARITGENAYRTLAEKAVAVQSDTAAALSTIQVEFGEIRARLTAVEKILKEVG